MELSGAFIHHVYFWLHNPNSEEDMAELLDGLRTLSAVTSIKDFHIGKPATTGRDVIDVSYSLSWLLIFESKDAQDSYQVDPIHLEFVERCSWLWEKVVVYDSVDA